MDRKVAIIDYKMGNLFSVEQACKIVGLEPFKTSITKEIENADAIILPGVGAFAEAMRNLRELNLADTLRGLIEKGKPFMGICLGFQLLFSKSYEFEITEGLGVFKGRVKKFLNKNEQNENIKVPQIGWNQICPYNELKWDNSLLNGIKKKEFMYFVHSFYVETDDKDIMLTYTDYEGLRYCSSIEFKNIFASQFHPEKSAVEGIKIYKNFANLINNRE